MAVDRARIDTYQSLIESAGTSADWVAMERKYPLGADAVLLNALARRKGQSTGPAGKTFSVALSAIRTFPLARTLPMNFSEERLITGVGYFFAWVNGFIVFSTGSRTKTESPFSLSMTALMIALGPNWSNFSVVSTITVPDAF